MADDSASLRRVTRSPMLSAIIATPSSKSHGGNPRKRSTTSSSAPFPSHHQKTNHSSTTAAALTASPWDDALGVRDDSLEKIPHTNNDPQSIQHLLSLQDPPLPPEKESLLQQQAQGSINMSGIYSASGFDILQFLERVVNRKNPVIQLGPVDFSCSFLISDATLPDMPLIYVSETFEKTTGYSAKDIIGKNCRFLQAPNGQVKPGSVRQHSDNNVISHMKACVVARQECQFSLVNYKKSGEPFINLVTIIPISLKDDGVVTHFIGFQIDLIQQPDSILQRMRDGTYHVNYQTKPVVSLPMKLIEDQDYMDPDFEDDDPLLVLNSKQQSLKHSQLARPEKPTLEEDEESERDGEEEDEALVGGDLLKENELTMQDEEESVKEEQVSCKRKNNPEPQEGTRPSTEMPFDKKQSRNMAVTDSSLVRKHKDKKVKRLKLPESHKEAYEVPILHSAFIDNCGDFVHILSIRGLFLYASPKATKELLGFEAEDLLGHNVSDFVHPSDLVFLLRELRSASPNQPINIVCRFRKHNGHYLYLELRGHVYEGTAGKRTRCIVMSGRQKKVGRLFAGDVLLPGDSTLPESWAKISPEGLFLYNCPQTQSLLGLTPDQVFGHCLFEYVNVGDHDRLRKGLTLINQSSTRFYDVPNLRLALPSGPIHVHLRLFNDSGSQAQHYFVQLKRLSDPKTGVVHPVDFHTLGSFSHMYQDGNLFDFLWDEDAASLYFEVNQLRVQNKKLREELETLAAQQSGGGVTKDSKGGPDKERQERSGSSSSSGTTDSVLEETASTASRNQRVPSYRASS